MYEHLVSEFNLNSSCIRVQSECCSSHLYLGSCFNYQRLMNKEDGLTMPDSLSGTFSLNRELRQFGGHLIYRLWIKKKINCGCQCQSHGCERGKIIVICYLY